MVYITVFLATLKSWLTCKCWSTPKGGTSNLSQKCFDQLSVWAAPESRLNTQQRSLQRKKLSKFHRGLIHPVYSFCFSFYFVSVCLFVHVFIFLCVSVSACSCLWTLFGFSLSHSFFFLFYLFFSFSSCFLPYWQILCFWISTRKLLLTNNYPTGQTLILMAVYFQTSKHTRHSFWISNYC